MNLILKSYSTVRNLVSRIRREKQKRKMSHKICNQSSVD